MMGMRGPERWCLMISGRGSNLQAVLENQENHHIALVVSNRKKAIGLKKARRSGVQVMTWNFQDQDFNGLLSELKRRKIHRIFLLGFMKILPPSFIEDFRGVILNVHPSLLPLYPGKDSFERSFHDLLNQNGVLGATVHEVNEDVDAGEIWIKQSFSRSSLSESQLRLTMTERRIVLRAMEKRTGKGKVKKRTEKKDRLNV